jgi:cyclopropane fatty-acyl-phospholipid synthase-like methyltransferase
MTDTFGNEYWDEIWRGERAGAMASSQTNPHLIQEVSELAPGTALDAGCGAGAEAIWLAAHGWQVTGADTAPAALAFAAKRAVTGGVAGRVKWLQADLAAWEPDDQYDLVTTFYAHPAMPQLAFYDRLASWVAPQGTLLIVGHLHHDSAHADDGEGHGHTEPPAAASATSAAITAGLDPAVWNVITAEESHRTMVVESDEVTLHDVVVRAVRR